jgi:hypothetical protein
MNRQNEAEQPAGLTPVQAWLLGDIDTATLHDRIQGCPELMASYGRAATDPAYAAALLRDAQGGPEPEAER